jgi:hypothetical protein
VLGIRGIIEFDKDSGLRWTLNEFVRKRRRCCLQAEGHYCFGPFLYHFEKRDRELPVAEWISSLSN